MTQEEKDLLLKDLCARLRYGIFLNIGNYSDYILQGIVNSDTNKPLIVSCEESNFNCSIEIVKPYLRPMSSMTEEERKGLTEKGIYIDDDFDICHDAYEGRNISLKYVVSEYTDWLNEHHFDYRDLISMGLALEASEGMYKTV